MSRHLSLTFLLISGGSLMAADSSTRCNYNWDMQIGVVRNFMEQLASSRERESEMLLQISLLKAQLSEKSIKKSMPRNCIEAAAGSFKSGVYKIHFERFNATPFDVFCNEETDFGGWTVIRRRINSSGDFNRGWQAYKDGFGDLEGNYWIGLEKLHALTSSCEQELYFEWNKSNGTKVYAKYTQFVIGSESEGYALKYLGNYTGNAYDSFTYLIGMQFITYDRNNDLSENGNCAVLFKEGWWSKPCLGGYLYGDDDDEGDGFDVASGNNNEEFKFDQMMIRPTGKCLRRLSLKN